MQTDDPTPTFHDARDLVRCLASVLAVHCSTHEQIDDALRTFLDVSVANRDLWLDVEDEEKRATMATCTHLLLRSDLFLANREYVRRQYVYCILQEDDFPVLHLIAAMLLEDGRNDLDTFQMMQDEGAFPRLLGLLQSGEYNHTPLRKPLLDLLCDMSRIQRLSLNDLDTIDDAFITYLFELIEQHSDDVEDPYHYTVIRLLLVLNEQYMCADSDLEKTESAVEPAARPSNRIVNILSHRGPAYRTFGENLILLLNREGGFAPQLLILKMLYLLFTNALTFEYFYTNDLHVLVDVIIRNLLDLDTDGQSHDQGRRNQRHFALRHTYLRVLYPLLRNTQLSLEGAHYKRSELRRLFHLLVSSNSQHFAPADETVNRLVTRCKQVAWISDPSDVDSSTAPSSELGSPISASETTIKNKMLGMHLADEGGSNLSVASVAAQVEKRAPAIPPPRRRGKIRTNDGHDTGKGNRNGNGDGTPQLQVSLPSLPIWRKGDIRATSPFADKLDETQTA